MDRKTKLEELKAFLDSGHENYNLATNLEQFFLGTRTGCNCKFNQVKSALNAYWEREGKKELASYE